MGICQTFFGRTWTLFCQEKNRNCCEQNSTQIEGVQMHFWCYQFYTHQHRLDFHTRKIHHHACAANICMWKIIATNIKHDILLLQLALAFTWHSEEQKHIGPMSPSSTRRHINAIFVPSSQDLPRTTPRAGFSARVFTRRKRKFWCLDWRLPRRVEITTKRPTFEFRMWLVSSKLKQRFIYILHNPKHSVCIFIYIYICVFPKIMVPQNGWFISWFQTLWTNGWFGGTTIFGNTHIYIYLWYKYHYMHIHIQSQMSKTHSLFLAMCGYNDRPSLRLSAGPGQTLTNLNPASWLKEFQRQGSSGIYHCSKGTCLLPIISNNCSHSALWYHFFLPTQTMHYKIFLRKIPQIHHMFAASLIPAHFWVPWPLFCVHITLIVILSDSEPFVACEWKRVTVQTLD